MNQTSLILNPVAPFDFEKTLETLKTFHADGVFRETYQNFLMQAFWILDDAGQGEVVVVKLENIGSLEQPKLLCTLFCTKKLDKFLVDKTKKQINFFLSLNDDLGDFYKLAKQDDAFKPVLDALYGYHQVKFSSIFACACYALVTQRTPNSFAFKTMQKLSEFLGERLELNSKTYTTFPEPQRFLDKDAAAFILEATNNTRKTERLLPIAEAFSKADEDFLKIAPYDEVAKWLKKIHGLGQWSVDYIMLRGLGRMERSPWTDTEILERISKVYTGGLLISKGDAKKLAETYGWWQGYWVHYLKLWH